MLKKAKVVAKVVAIFVSKHAITSIIPIKSKKTKKSIRSTLMIKSIKPIKSILSIKSTKLIVLIPSIACITSVRPWPKGGRRRGSNRW